MNFVRAIALTSIKQLIRRQFPDVHSLSTEDLAMWLNRTEKKKPLLLDARTPREYAVSHLPDARLAPPDLSTLETWEDVTETTLIVIYCSVGYRSARLALRLRALGYGQVLNLEGSIFEWAGRGYPVYQGTEVVRQVHPFNSLWGLLLDPDLRMANPD
jgi:rhodanese-related sulfurtransferase